MDFKEKNIRTFTFNNAYSLIFNENDNKYYIKKLTAVFKEDSYFDPNNDFLLISPSDRNSYITYKIKKLMKDEILKMDKDLYKKIWDDLDDNDYDLKDSEDYYEDYKEDNKLNEVNDTDLNKAAENQNTTKIIQQTVVDKNLTKNINKLISALNKKAEINPYEEAIIQSIIDKGKNISYESLLKEFSPKLDDFIKTTYGLLPKKIEIYKENEKVTDLQGIFHEKFETILKIVQRNVPIMLVGPAGSGKNYTLEQVAKSLNLEFYFTNAVTQEYKIAGFIDANGKYHETQFYKAFKDGGLFFLDEMDASAPEVLILLNAAIANGYFDFPTGRVRANENFRLVSAANTVGRGASMEYSGRQQLDAATLDRFAIVDFGYDENVEQQLAATPQLYSFIKNLREVIKENSIRYVVSMRATINSSKLIDIMDKYEIINSVILKGIDEDDLELIANKINGSNEYGKVLKERIL